MNLCAIPARGSSKCTLKKYIIKFHDKPFIALSIDLAITIKILIKLLKLPMKKNS